MKTATEAPALTLHLRGLKAADQEIRFGRLNVYSAPNGTGKSAVADALRLLFLGHVPALGKTAGDTAQLVRGSEGSVQAIFSNGRTARRTITRTRTGAEREAKASWVKGGSTSTHGDAIRSLVGESDLDAAELLDIRGLLNETPNRRAARINELLGATAAAPKTMGKQAAQAAARRLAGVESGDNVTDLLDTIEGGEAVAQRFGAIADTVASLIIESGLSEALGEAKSSRSSADGTRRRQAAAREEIETRLNTLAAPAPEEIDALREERTALDRECGAMKAQENEAKMRADGLVVVEQEQRDASARMKEAEATLKAMKPDHERKLVADIEGAEATLATISPPAAPDDKLAVDHDEAALAIDRKIAVMKLPDLPDLTKLRADYSARKARLDECRRSPWAEVRRIGRRVLKLDGGTQDGARLVEMAEAQSSGREEELEAELAQAETAGVKAKKALDHAQLARAKAEEQRASLVSEARSLRAAAVNVRETNRATYDKAVDDWQRRRGEYQARVTGLRGELEQLRRERSHAEHARALAAGTLEQVEKRLQDLRSPAAKTGGTPKRMAEIAKRLSVIEGALENAEQAAGVRRELESIVDELRRAEADWSIWSAYVWALEEMRREDLERRGGPIRAAMAKFLAAAHRKESPFFRDGSAFGWARDGHEIPVGVLSGGEWALFATALTYALIALRKPELRLLLVEACEADVGVLRSIMAGIEAVREDLTVALVLTYHPVTDAPRWTIHHAPTPSAATRKPATAAAPA